MGYNEFCIGYGVLEGEIKKFYKRLIFTVITVWVAVFVCIYGFSGEYDVLGTITEQMDVTDQISQVWDERRVTRRGGRLVS